MQSKAVKNIFFGFGGQALVMILGIIVPRIMIVGYGSDVNGLIGTVTQIFTYMALLEGGISQAARNGLFQPINAGDREGISYILSVARQYFRKITVYYGLGVIGLAVLLPVLLKTELDYATVFFVVLLQGLSGVITFYFIQTQTALLGADGRAYINNGINTLNQTLSYAAKILLAYLGVNIIFLQLAYFLITVAKVITYRAYFAKHYSWIDYKKVPKTAKLKDRNAYIVSEIAWTIFSSTDMIILSIFVNTQMSSVYSVYNLVYTSISLLLNAVYSSLVYILGQTYHEDLEKYEKIHDTFTSMFFGGMTILMCVTYILIIPFVRLYTAGITDVEYIYSELPLLFCLVQILSWSRYVTGNLTAIAGYAKYTGIVSVIEALINVVLSIILVQQFGIVGVLIATVIALPLKVVFCTYLSDKKILHRSCKKSILMLGGNYLLFFLVVLINPYISLTINNYFDFIKYGILITGICTVVGIGVNLCMNPGCLHVLKKFKNR